MNQPFICECIYQLPNMLIADFNSKYLTPLFENLNREEKFRFLMGDFNMNLMRSISEYDNSQFYNAMCSYFLHHLFFNLQRLMETQKF